MGDDKTTSRGVFEVASSMIAFKAKAASEHARSVRAAVGEEVAETRQTLRETLRDYEPVVRETLREYEPKVRESVSNVRNTVRENAPKTVRRAFGTMLSAGEGQSAESVCDYLALPFIHSAALQPEIKRLYAALDVCPEEAMLRTAHEQLRALEEALDAHGPLLLPAADGVAGAADCGSSASIAEASATAVHAVSGLVQREAGHNATCELEARAAAERAAEGREEFVRRVKSGLTGTPETELGVQATQ